MKKKSVLIIVLFLIVALVVGLTVKSSIDDKRIIRQVTSDKQLYKLYEGEGETSFSKFMKGMAIMPMTFPLLPFMWLTTVSASTNVSGVTKAQEDYDGISTGGLIPTTSDGVASANSSSKSSTASDVASNVADLLSRDHSTTNIQVENVDEADVVKTDGRYIYSISGNNIVITDTKDLNNPKIVASLRVKSSGTPEELLVYKDKVIVISSKSESYSRETIVEVIDISDIENPKRTKSFELDEGYYTSRCIDNKLYIISSGRVKTESKRIKREYKEDNVTKSIELKNMYTIKDIDPDNQTIIASYDLDSSKDIEIQSYFMDVSNAYVSEKGIYLLDYDYTTENISTWDLIKSIFNFKGLLGIIDEFEELSEKDRAYKTTIYKFTIDNEKGKVVYNSKGSVEGKTIDQYSLDEKDGHLRVASYDSSKGAHITILDEKLNEIGKSDYVAAKETLYSSRFMGNKAYIVTYRNMDPLFVIDIEDEKQPKVLGELHIPGYSTYLHPYDENHIIGIGIETEETTRRDYRGRTISTGATVKGMKMALFDVSNVDYPKQVSQVVIGDRYTKSAILSNPKALLFSKEKGIIAIPVNNYKDELDDEIDATSNTSIRSYYQNNEDYISEGYLVYNINLEDGITLKGRITHTENTSKDDKYSSKYSTVTKLLRGLYIENNLFTVDENEIKVSDINTLNLIADVIITTDKNGNIVGKEKDINEVEKNVTPDDNKDNTTVENTTENTVNNTTNSTVNYTTNYTDDLLVVE